MTISISFVTSNYAQFKRNYVYFGSKISKFIVMTQFSMNFSRLPKDLQSSLGDIYECSDDNSSGLPLNSINVGDATHLLKKIKSNSINLSVWSPPYFVGKDYESHLSYESWKRLLSDVIAEHFRILKPGSFLAINIADILVFKDSSMPKIQADVVHRKKVSLTKDQILSYIDQHPNSRRGEIAAHFKCSEQTIDRRLNGNNIRGGKTQTQTRVKIVGGAIERYALEAGLYTYDRRVWAKDAAWENSRWANLSYRSVDEFEYIYIFWKPGITKYDRSRLSSKEWRDWGSRGVWSFPSVRVNDDHSAKFPPELPRRLIKLFTDENDVVLDCFMGSGTTALTSNILKRNFIGIELNLHYAKLSVDNIFKRSGFKSKLISHVIKSSDATE